MTFPTSIALWASVTALLLSIGASLVTVLLWRQSQLTSAARLLRMLSDLQETVEDQDKRIRNLVARYRMQNVRLARPEASPESPAATDPEQAAEDARRNLNDQLARGAVRVNHEPPIPTRRTP